MKGPNCARTYAKHGHDRSPAFCSFSPFRLLCSAIWLCPIRHGFSHDTFAGFCHLSLPDNRRCHLKNKDATMILCLDVYWIILMCIDVSWHLARDNRSIYGAREPHLWAQRGKIVRDTKLKPSKAAMEQDAQEFAHLQDGFDLFNLPPDWSLHNGLAEPQILVRPGWQRLLKKATLSKVIWKWECSKEGITVAHFMSQSHGEKNSNQECNVKQQSIGFYISEWTMADYVTVFPVAPLCLWNFTWQDTSRHETEDTCKDTQHSNDGQWTSLHKQAASPDEKLAWAQAPFETCLGTNPKHAGTSSSQNGKHSKLSALGL